MPDDLRVTCTSFALDGSAAGAPKHHGYTQGFLHHVQTRAGLPYVTIGDKRGTGFRLSELVPHVKLRSHAMHCENGNKYDTCAFVQLEKSMMRVHMFYWQSLALMPLIRV